MRHHDPSLTAYRVALMRAAHQLLDHPVVFEDPVALNIVGAKGRSEINQTEQKYKSALNSSLRAIVIARSRLVESELSMAVRQGIRQYVVLGAGLDTFAYRNPYSSDGLRVFEVDHPATQEWKKMSLFKENIPIPATLRFVPVDFETQSLEVQLKDAGFKIGEQAFFSWLGVTMYLTREAFMATLKAIFSLAPSGGLLLFDYITPAVSQNFLRRLIFRLLAKKLARSGEPFKCFLEPESLMDDLSAMGFSHLEDIGPEEINKTFFQGRTDKMKVGQFGHLMKASR